MFIKNTASYLGKNAKVAGDMPLKGVSRMGGGSMAYGTALTAGALLAGYHGGKFGMNLMAGRKSRRRIDEYFEDVKRNPNRHSFS